MRVFPIVLLLTGCATGDMLPSRAIGEASVAVRRGVSGWTATYRLPPGKTFVFAHSALDRGSEQPWRLKSWRVETPGVELVRAGQHDVLTATGKSVPRQVTIRFEPFAQSLIGDNDPALVLSDGTTALVTNQFDVLPAASVEAVEAAGGDIEKAASGALRINASFVSDAGSILLNGAAGKRIRAAGPDSYAVFVPSSGRSRRGASAFVDPALPAWLRTRIGPFLESLLVEYEQRLGPRPGAAPILIAQWSGPTPNLAGMGGSVLNNVIVMNFEGAGLLSENQRIKDRSSLFLAHEAVHFWLGQNVVVADRRHRWITEGAADLIAARTVASREPAFAVSQRLATLTKECATLLEDGNLNSLVAQSGGDRVHYACGTVLSLIAEAATGGNFDLFARSLIMRASNNGNVVTPDHWLTQLRTVARNESLVAGVDALLDGEITSPSEHIEGLYKKAGVSQDIAPTPS